MTIYGDYIDEGYCMFEEGVYLSLFYCLFIFKDIAMDMLEEKLREERCPDLDVGGGGVIKLSDDMENY